MTQGKHLINMEIYRIDSLEGSRKHYNKLVDYLRKKSGKYPIAYEIIRILSEHVSAEGDVNSGLTPLQIVLQHYIKFNSDSNERKKSVEMADFLVNRGAMYEKGDQLFAACTPHSELLKVLLKRTYGFYNLEYQYRTNLYSELLSRSSCNIVNGDSILHVLIRHGISDTEVMSLLSGSIHGNNIDMNIENSAGETLLHVAVKANNKAMVKFILEHDNFRFDPKEKDGDSEHLIHSASRHGFLEVLKLLVESGGVDINVLNSYHDTALHLAVQNKRSNIVEYLVDQKGVNLECRNLSGNTPLHVATKTCNLDLVSFLVERGADLMAKNEVGNTPLHIAAKKQQLNIALFLIEKGADLMVKNEAGNTPLHIAVSTRNTLYHAPITEKGRDIAAVLIQKSGEINLQNEAGNTPLHIAAMRDDLETTLRFIERDITSIKIFNKRGETPFDLIKSDELNDFVNSKHSLFRNVDVLANFVQMGCSSNLKNYLLEEDVEGLKSYLKSQKFHITEAAVLGKDGLTPLHVLIRNNRETSQNMLNLLIEHGADVNVTDSQGQTLLHFAIKNGSSKALIEFLLESKARLDLANNEGYYPVHIAVNNASIDILKLLIKYGADVNAVDWKGRTPLHKALHKKLEKVLIELLLKSKARADLADDYSDYPVHIAVNNGSIDVLELLIKHGADVNAVDREGRTPLHKALHEKREKVFIELLLKSNARLNLADYYGDYPVHIAVNDGSIDILELLINHGADVNSVDWEGRTSLLIAAENHNVEIARLLLINKAYLNSVDNHGRTILHSAISRKVDNEGKKGKLEMIKLLLDSCNMDPNVFPKGCSYTNLGLAASIGEIEIVKLLTRRGANLFDYDKEGNTPLHLALRANNITVLEHLLDLANDTNLNCVCDSKGNTLLHNLIEYRNDNFFEIVRLLETKSKYGLCTNVLNTERITPLSIAAKIGKLDIVEYLLEKGAITNIGDEDNKTPLHYSIEHGHTEIVKLLLENGALVNEDIILSYIVKKQHDQDLFNSLLKRYTDNTGFTIDRVLLYLTKSSRLQKHYSCREFLLKNGAKVEKGNRIIKLVRSFFDSVGAYLSPEKLYKSVILDDIESVKGICSKIQVDINALYNHNGSKASLLDIAVRGGSEEMVSYLLDLYTNSCNSNYNYISAIKIAVDNRLGKILNKLLSALDHSSRENFINEMIKKDCLEAVTLIFEPDIQFQENQIICTTEHILLAVEHGSSKVLHFLLKNQLQEVINPIVESLNNNSEVVLEALDHISDNSLRSEICSILKDKSVILKVDRVSLSMNNQRQKDISSKSIGGEEDQGQEEKTISSVVLINPVKQRLLDDKIFVVGK